MYARILQAVEEDPKYWDVLSAALAVGWLDIVVCVVCNSFTIIVNISITDCKIDIVYDLYIKSNSMISEFQKYALNAW